MSRIRIERVSYGGWPNCYSITNGEVELIATTDVGPRIIRCGFVSGQNLFYEAPEQLGGSGESKWLMRGGHRLWVAPEVIPDTYALDNSPVEARVDAGVLTLRQPVERETGLQKQLAIRLAESRAITVTHRITNVGQKSRQLSPWGLTQMAPGGLGITTFPPRAGHDEVLLPTHPLVMWAYTYFNDERWKFLGKYLLLQQTPANPYPQKTGLFNQQTVGAYLLGSDLFLKRTTADPQARYPDLGTSFQIFVNGEFLELETLGPLIDLQPGGIVEHVETWSLHRNIALRSHTDEELDRVLKPLLG